MESLMSCVRCLHWWGTSPSDLLLRGQEKLRGPKGPYTICAILTASLCVGTTSVSSSPHTRRSPPPSHQSPSPSHRNPAPSHRSLAPSHQRPPPSHRNPAPRHRSPAPRHRSPAPSHRSPSCRSSGAPAAAGAPDWVFCDFLAFLSPRYCDFFLVAK